MRKDAPVVAGNGFGVGQRLLEDRRPRRRGRGSVGGGSVGIRGFLHAVVSLHRGRVRRGRCAHHHCGNVWASSARASHVSSTYLNKQEEETRSVEVLTIFQHDSFVK